MDANKWKWFLITFLLISVSVSTGEELKTSTDADETDVLICYVGLCETNDPDDVKCLEGTYKMSCKSDEDVKTAYDTNEDELNSILSARTGGDEASHVFACIRQLTVIRGKEVISRSCIKVDPADIGKTVEQEMPRGTRFSCNALIRSGKPCNGLANEPQQQQQGRSLSRAGGNVTSGSGAAAAGYRLFGHPPQQQQQQQFLGGATSLIKRLFLAGTMMVTAAAGGGWYGY